MKKYSLSIVFFLLICGGAYSQTVFFEGFDEADNATTGTENSGGGVTWTATCPGSIAATDYFKVLSGQLEARDTNSPAAAFESGSIDISSCVGLSISFDVSEAGTMEGCADCGGTGIICIDWVKLEYNLDGGGWTDVAGTSCPATMTEAPGELIFEGDIAGGGPTTYTSPCIDFGSNLQIRISCMSWASTEYWRFDNITVACNDCVLPVEISDLTAELEGGRVLLNWTTKSEQDNDYFIVERSIDGVNFMGIGTIDGQGNSVHENDYHFADNQPTGEGVIYYRLRQIDFNGEAHFSKIKSVRIPKKEVRYYDGSIHFFVQGNEEANYTLNIYDLGGKVVHSETVGNSANIAWDKSGFYLIEVPELNLQQKIAVP